MTDYEKIAKAIHYITENFTQQPCLEDVSEYIGISPFHFQKMFKEWAGVSPKKFLQYISLEHSKKLLNAQYSLSETSYNTGLSGSSRLHDLFIKIEGMTPGEFKNGGKDLLIYWNNYECTFGKLIIASTSKGICHIAFTESIQEGLAELRKKFPAANCIKATHNYHEEALSVFNYQPSEISRVNLHLKGTAFQLKVWEALLKIPSGSLTTYSGIAEVIGAKGAARAVGTAVGDNPVAYLIPCHRVIRATGIIGEYHWGSVRKKVMIAKESAEVYGE